FNKIVYSGLLSTFSFEYADKNRKKLNAYGSGKNFVSGFTISDALLQEFITFLDNNGVKKDAWGLNRSEKGIRLQLKAYIGRNIFNNDGFYPVLHTSDKTIKKALEVLGKAR
ncbi:MAG: peptidase S41, partial [Bacteroidia bacterium]|nr:peptidase S41 [Bacteroidia bacterium]